MSPEFPACFDPTCPDCSAPFVGVEYAWDHPQHYDGISEWWCESCGLRLGRWTGRRLKVNEPERRFGYEEAFHAA